MSETGIGILIAVIVAAVVAGLFFFRRKQKTDNYWHRSPENRARDTANAKHPHVSPDGIRFYYENDLKHGIHYEGAAKAGIEYTLRKMRECDKPYPDFNMNLADFTVCVLETERDSNGDPSFRVPIFHTDPYFNSDYDKMKGQKGQPHYVLVAGQTINVGNDGLKNCFIIAAHTVAELEHLERVSEFETEHIGLAHADGRRFEDTKDHVTKGHPIIDGSCLPSAVGFHRHKDSPIACLPANIKPIK